jgi:hypothetical protein
MACLSENVSRSLLLIVVDSLPVFREEQACLVEFWVSHAPGLVLSLALELPPAVATSVTGGLEVLPERSQQYCTVAQEDSVCQGEEVRVCEEPSSELLSLQHYKTKIVVFYATI